GQLGGRGWSGAASTPRAEQGEDGRPREPWPARESPHGCLRHRGKSGTRGSACWMERGVGRGRHRGFTKATLGAYGAVLTPLIPSLFGRGGDSVRPSFPLSAYAERGTG